MKQPLDILKQYWGYDSFRPLQDNIIQSILDKKDTLALLPTGGGKSITFQVPALLADGICIVISPLIALMKDQVERLKSIGINAEAIYSGMHYKTIDRLFDNCIHGNIKLLYISPERLKTDLALARIKQMNVSLIAIDEAHCISQWGFDFRPSYLEIKFLRTIFPKVPMLALTATATPRVIEDIVEHLDLKNPSIVKGSFKRSNIAVNVVTTDAKYAKLLSAIKRADGTSIVYVRNRRKTKEVSNYLQSEGISSTFYHAGLDSKERSKRQQQWLNNVYKVVVSTNAFGMGIDKPDVRLVVHLDLPDALESYVQEYGRAGRDGKRAEAILLYDDFDIKELNRQHGLAFPPISFLRKLYDQLHVSYKIPYGEKLGNPQEFNLSAFSERIDIPIIKVYHGLRILEKEGYFIISEGGNKIPRIQVMGSESNILALVNSENKHGRVLQAVLRLYDGVYQQSTRVNLKEVSGYTKLSIDAVLDCFAYLSQRKYVAFQNESSHGQITFLEERVNAAHLDFDFKRYKWLKQNFLDRQNAMIKFVKDVYCRERIMLEYFGEQADKDCGHCDVCKLKQVSELSNSELVSIKSRMHKLLFEGPQPLKSIMQSLENYNQDLIIEAITILTDESVIKRKEDLFYWNEKISN